MLDVQCQYARGSLIVRIGGELDFQTAAQFRSVVEKELDETGAQNLILNLEALKFVDSSGLGAILGRYKRVMAAGGNVYMVGVAGQSRRILELSGVLRIIPVFKSEKQALGA